ncbi:inositol monophosphatase [Klebsormidium nitens]|uniref:Inositol-1-monophosphatase n=1 Tax=Klebsormidium nitens TaxID=105231 RepID=A0A1Y1HKN1_KLENI|nr:inositol monophosphatase [Klebsormidium nitens]|eukprot:GAQ78513.1 inositol monophosphatase [Klebsormidium nitens]
MAYTTEGAKAGASPEDLKMEIEGVAKKAAMEAGRLIVAASGKAQNVETKGVRSDLVTEVDKACEDLIKQRVQESFPDHSILGEETSTSEELERLDATLADSDWTWIVDPIDGTLNFVGGLPLSVVSIGVAKANRVEVGVVFNPYSGELFTARRGEGAFLNGERISVLPPETELEDGAVSVGFPSKRPVRERMLRGVSAVAPHARTVRALGTAALHMSYVAAGKLACFFELNLKPWDVAAAWLIVEEAGGRVTDMAGKPMRLRAGPILASCGGQLHERVLSLLREAECTGEESDLR